VLGAGLLLDDVLEQEVARIRVRALAVDGRAPARELRDVLVVLRGPRAELGAGQLALDPLFREWVEAAVRATTAASRRARNGLLLMDSSSSSVVNLMTHDPDSSQARSANATAREA
jgi:hypothetical protein